LAEVALGAAALGFAGTAAAFPNAGTAADVIDSLKAEGYTVPLARLRTRRSTGAVASIRA
jgi:hypothetical protein